MVVRRPAVAGTFYPSDPADLSTMIERSYVHPLGPGKAPPSKETNAKVALIVVPHAGYEYSGPVAAHGYLHASSIAKPELIVIVGPNHYGIGSGVSTFGEGYWETPLGRLRVDLDASSKLVKEAGMVSIDPRAHELEHSIEVQLPFLQKIFGDAIPILPISLIFQDPVTTRELGEALGDLLKGRSVIMAASSDLTHYESYDSATRKDSALLEKIIQLDFDGLYSTLETEEVTACGFGAVATVITAARALNMNRGELLKYANSGDTTGDKSRVVGYGAARFT